MKKKAVFLAVAVVTSVCINVFAMADILPPDKMGDGIINASAPILVNQAENENPFEVEAE